MVSSFLAHLTDNGCLALPVPFGGIIYEWSLRNEKVKYTCEPGSSLEIY